MNIVIILIGNRADSAVKVQKILTENGDIIKTRLGINRTPGEEDPGAGFIFLELCGPDESMDHLCDALNSIEGVKAECLKLDPPTIPCR